MVRLRQPSRDVGAFVVWQARWGNHRTVALEKGSRLITGQGYYMSRIGKQPVALPAGVEVTQKDGTVAVKGPKGSLSQPVPQILNVAVDGGVLTVTRVNDSQEARAQHGLIRTLIANMVKGVTDGFVKHLDISGVGYRAQLQGTTLHLALGFSHPVLVEPRPGITFEVGMDTNTRSPFISVSGIDKQMVGQQAAEIRGLKKPEPYKGKGIRYRGEVIRRKAGKAGKAGGGKGKK